MRAAPVLPNDARPLLNSWVTFSWVLHHWSENDQMTLKHAAVKLAARWMCPPRLWRFLPHSAGGRRSSAKPAGPQRGWAGCCRWRSGWRSPPRGAPWVSGPRRCRQPGSWSHVGPGWPVSLGWNIDLGGFFLHFWPVSPPSTACTLAWGQRFHVFVTYGLNINNFTPHQVASPFLRPKTWQFIRNSDADILLEYFMTPFFHRLDFKCIDLHLYHYFLQYFRLIRL